MALFMTLLPGIISGLVFGVLTAVWVAGYTENLATTIISFFLSCLLIGGGVCGFSIWRINNTESGARSYHSLEANYEGGIEREVIVYNIQGDVIEHYQGKFDVTYDDDRIMFDDENGKRHVIFYTTSNVIINEL